MASKTISCSQVLLATAMILLAIYAKESAAHNPFCQKCREGDVPKCESLVKGATSWEQALTNVIKAIMREAQKVKPIVESLPSKVHEQVKKESLGSTCKQGLDSINDYLHEVVYQLKNGDPHKSIPSELSAVLSIFSDCTDALDQFDVQVPELYHFGAVVSKYTSISLAVARVNYFFLSL